MRQPGGEFVKQAKLLRLQLQSKHTGFNTTHSECRRLQEGRILGTKEQRKVGAASHVTQPRVLPYLLVICSSQG
jgi:hypothetical protein